MGGIVIYPLPVKDFHFEVGENSIPGKSFIHKFGRNPDVDTGGFEAIWNNGGDYLGMNPTAAETIEVFSSDANDAGTLVSSGAATGGSETTIEDSGATFISDGVAIGDVILNDSDRSHGTVTEVTSETVLTTVRMDQSGVFEGKNEAGDNYRIVTAASTGAAVIELLFLLDENFSNETSEFVILNGLTGVTTIGTYVRCSRGTVIIAGSVGFNVGTITSRQSVTTANIFMLMPIGYNETMIAAYTVPVELDGHVLTWFAGLSGKTNANCNIRLVIRHRNEVFRVEEEFSIIGAGSSNVIRQFQIPKNEVSPGSDIKIMADTDANNTGIAAGFDIILAQHV